MSEPVLKIPEGWEERAPEGWEWQTLWDAVEAGDHGYAHSRTEEAIAADIDKAARGDVHRTPIVAVYQAADFFGERHFAGGFPRQENGNGDHYQRARQQLKSRRMGANKGI